MTNKQKDAGKKPALAAQTSGTSPSRSEELFRPALLRDIRLLIEGARGRAAASVNSEMVTPYWSIGERIRKDMLASERAAYGERIVNGLSRKRRVRSWIQPGQPLPRDPLRRDFPESENCLHTEQTVVLDARAT